MARACNSKQALMTHPDTLNESLQTAEQILARAISVWANRGTCGQIEIVPKPSD